MWPSHDTGGVTVTVLTGVDPTALERRAFERASAVADDEPGSVVVAAADGGQSGAVADAWAAAHDPLRVRVTDLDRLAGDAYERAGGPGTRLDTPTRRQTIDRALRAVAAETGLSAAHAHGREVRELLSELAAAGYDDPAELADHVDTHLDDRTATVLSRVAETAATLQQSAAPASYTLPEAYRAVCDADDPEALVDADALVVSGYTDLADTQIDLLECLAARTTTDVVVTLPLAETPDRRGDETTNDEPGDDETASLDGANAYVADTYTTLVALADEHVHVGADATDASDPTDTSAGDATVTDASDPTDTATPSLATAVGRTFTRTATVNDAVPSGLRWESAATPMAESRAVARRVRRQIADGAAPEDVLVVVPELLSYRDRLADAFDAVGVPVSDAGRPPLGQTCVGRAAIDLVDCCLSSPTARDLASLASNPAVDLDYRDTTDDSDGHPDGDSSGDHPLDADELLALVDSLPTDGLADLRAELDAEADAAVAALLDRVRAVRTASREATVARLRELFAHVGLAVGDDRPTTDGTHEAGARTAVARTLAAVGRVGDPDSERTDDDGDAREAAGDATDPLRRVADALEGLRVAPGGGRPGTVEIVGVQDALGRSSDHLHVVGLTRAAFPPEDRRSRFFRRAFEALPSVTATDHQARARYQFAVLVGAAETVALGHPEVGTDGDERLPSPILTELARVTGLKPESPADSADPAAPVDSATSTDSTDPVDSATPTDSTDPADSTVPSTPSIASAGDLQRALTGHDGETRETALTEAVRDGVVSSATAENVRRGAACLAGRVGDGFGEFDGHVDPATVAAHHDPAPFSPTGLRSYARCGFRYYADRVLGLPEEPEYPLEPTALDRGTLVHDTLERFFDGLLVETDGDPVDLTTFDRASLERRLLDAAETELSTLDAPTDDAFGTRWLETLLAGLATPAANDHYGDDHPHRGTDRGVFVRFLDEEFDNDDRVLAVESPLDFTTDPDAPTGAERDDDAYAVELEAPDGRTVAVRGRVDRVAVEVDDTDGGESGVESVGGRVHDYKTSDPTTKRTFGGIDFQLPIYTVAARRELTRRYGDALDEVDGGFYTVEPPATVRRKRTLLETIYRNGGDATEFEQFLDAEIPERVADVADSVADGAFHTTTLDADTAGCDHCRFADVCGVRHHRRRERAEAADDAGHYVPQAARPTSYYDEIGGEES